jgi:hypothetical protein
MTDVGFSCSSSGCDLKNPSPPDLSREAAKGYNASVLPVAREFVSPEETGYHVGDAQEQFDNSLKLQ